LTPEAVAKLDIVDTDHLLTVMVVVPKALEADFRNKYSTIGATIASFGGPDWTNSTAIGQNDGKFGVAVKRSAVKGSPVVPNSLKKVAEEGDLLMFSVTVLRGHYQAGQYVDNEFVPGVAVDYLDAIKTAFRECRYIVRDFSYDSVKSGGIDGEIAKSQSEMKQVRAATVRWCKAHFGEIFNAFIHLKVIQAFVESVLRYGLPVDFVAFFLEPNLKREKELLSLLTDTVVRMRPELRMKKILSDEEEGEDQDASHLPYVCQKFSVIGGANSVA
jgi:V-type H+-transporting ATPase subunit C